MPVVDHTPDGPAGRVPSLSGAARRGARFGKNEDGATAVEFGLVAVPFFALMFAILETAIVFFAGQLLETAVGDTGRLVRTGQAHEQGMSAEQFKAAVCTRMFSLIDCDGLSIDVRTFPTFDSIQLGVVVDEDGELVVEDFDYQIGEPGDIVVVKVLYQWPVIVTQLGNNLANLPNGKHVLSATTVFKNEPFPW
jgi:Flp pilus assembly protein TadG